MNAQDYSPRNWIPIPTTLFFFLTTLLDLSPVYANETLGLTYPIVDTGQVNCFNNYTVMDAPAAGEAFYGQDAQHIGHQTNYTLSDDGLTVTDNVTGLTWTQSPDLNGDGVIDIDDKLTFDEAQVYPDTLNAAQFGGYDDWCVPTIKELYSLMDFTGITVMMSAAASTPYINTDNWQDALAQVVSLNEQNYLGYSDWRLPNAKELQGLLDYTRSPDTTDSAAIDPNFNATHIIDEFGVVDYPFYWTSTTHEDGPDDSYAVYICFGEALGWMPAPFGNNYTLLDVHGAGAQRSDPKSGDPADYPYGHGPQGDVIRITNYVRLVRNV